ncbi:hypothetical protein H2248_011805 [Termitomyces sp. 'cryptogamus']|nr:hypothetical protein H2248_011805 [Termitomyces sp. 'cryptogamus']
MPEQFTTGQSVTTPKFGHTPVLPTCRTSLRGPASSGPSQDRYKSSPRSSPSVTSVHDISASEEATGRPEHQFSESSSTFLQGRHTSHLALPEDRVQSHPVLLDHPLSLPENQHPTQWPPSEQTFFTTSSRGMNEADPMSGRSSFTSSPSHEVITHVSTPQHLHSLDQLTTIPSTRPLRTLQYDSVSDIPFEGTERDWSMAPSLPGAGLGAHPDPSVIASHNHEVSPPAGEKYDMQCDTWIVPPTLTEVYDHSPASPASRLLVPPPIDSAETILDDFVVQSAVAYTSLTHKYGSGDSEVVEQARQLCDMYLGMFRNLEDYKRFLDYRGESAQKIIDSIQSLLDDNSVDQQFRAILVVALSRLARKSELYPTRFFLHDVTRSGDTITEGYFGEIEKGLFAGEVVCIKIPRFKMHNNSDTRSYRRALSREIMPWAQISHENVLPFYGIHPLGDGRGRFGIVCPFFDNGDVVDYLVKFPNTDRRSLINGVAAGMSHLHDNGIVHGDIKGRNILVSSTVPLRAVLADFGLATVADTNGLMSPDLTSSGDEGGTKQFEAPELFDPSIPYRRSKASDVYAFSMACYEIISGNIPFPGRHGNHVMIMVGRGVRPGRPVGKMYQDRGLDNVMWKLIENCWEQDPGQRPSALKILERLSETSTAVS